MYPNDSRLYSFATGLIVLFLVAPAVSQLKTLDRNLEPVVISGAAFPEFVGAAIAPEASEVFLYAYRGNSQAWEQIPFQFDEKNSAGKYFNPNVDEVAGLDDNDELVFMAKDAGDRNLVSWIDDLDSRGFVRYEIKLNDPLTGKAAWVYLYRSRSLTFSPNLIDYIQYFKSTTSSRGADKISSLFYELINAPNGFPWDLIIPVSAGGNGLDLMDKLKFRARATLGLTVNIDEDDIQFQTSKSDSVRFKEGRIRVIRELDATLKVDVPFPFPDQEINFGTPPAFYYPFSVDIDLEIPDLRDASISSGRMSFDLDARASNPKMKFVSANNPEPGFVVDGVANESPNRTVDNLLPGGNWVYVNGSQGTLVHRFPLQPNVGGKRELYFKDNNANDSGDTGDKRSYGDVGIDITNNISPPFTLSYQGYFLGKEYTSEIGNQIALYDQNPLQLDFAPQDFGAVPVELVAFNATVNQQDVHLDWLTATETNNFGFHIERRLQDGDWEKLAFLAGKGTTTEPSRYEFVDRNLQAATYDYRLKQIDTDGAFEYSGIVTATIGLPTTFMLAQNFPNPFNPTTEIQYQLAVSENLGETRTLLKIYNILGKEVRTLVDEEQAPGFYRVSWDGRDDFGQRPASGIYIYRLQSGKFVATRKMALLQ